MTELSEALLPMVGAHSARSDSAERQALYQKMRGDVVHRHCARDGLIEYPAQLAPITAEVVRSQWACLPGDPMERLFQPIVREDRQNRCADLLPRRPS